MKTLPIRPIVPEPAPAPTRAAAAPAAWRLSRLLSAPHRLGFGAAALMMAASAAWWAVVLVARHAGIAVPWAVPPNLAHGLLMTMGFMPLFIVGFLFTAGPRWLRLPDVPARPLVAPVAAMLGGWAVALAGFHADPLAAAAGLAVVAAGWADIVRRFAGLLRASPAPDRLHARLIAAAAALGAVATAWAAAAVGTGDTLGARAAIQLALWGAVAPIFAIVSHRMIPFFTASALPQLDAWRPGWLLATMLGALALVGAGAVAAALGIEPPPVLAWLRTGLEAIAAVLLLWVARRWGLVQSLRIRLLAMLHGGFVWLGFALLLAALSHLLEAAGRGSLGLAPLHALTIGYLGATLFAMVTRVAAGHSGRPLAADRVAWTLYWVVQAAALLRVVAEVWPAGHAPLTLAAAAAWAVGAVGWSWRYGRWLGRPRVDGRPG